MTADAARLAEALVLSCNTITIATRSASSAWAAPVYYVYEKGGFYFFSSPKSRHVTEALAAGAAAGSIYEAGAGWKEIRGIQMTGSIHKVLSPVEAARAVSSYLKKFPFTGDFFGGSGPDLDGFADRFGVRLYCFRPGLILYTDNSISFGFRSEVTLPN